MEEYCIRKKFNSILAIFLHVKAQDKIESMKNRINKIEDLLYHIPRNSHFEQHLSTTVCPSSLVHLYIVAY